MSTDRYFQLLLRIKTMRRMQKSYMRLLMGTRFLFYDLLHFLNKVFHLNFSHFLYVCILKLISYSRGYQPMKGKYFITCMNLDTLWKPTFKSLVIWICVFIGYLDSYMLWNANITKTTHSITLNLLLTRKLHADYRKCSN